MTRVSVLDYRKVDAAFDAYAALRATSRRFGRSLPAQLADVWSLRRSIGRLTMREYYAFQLYDDARFTRADKERFLGKRAQDSILQQCTWTNWWALAHDKVVFYDLMRAYDFPVPRVVATYHPFRRIYPAVPLRTRDELRDFLRGARFPLFAKPVGGMYSVGTVRVDAFDRDADELVAHSGQRVSVTAFADGVGRYAASGGYMFQEVEHPHERIREICGDRLATVRVVVLVEPTGAEIFRTLWKIPTGPHVADNYWRRGNMLGAIDPATGAVTRAVTGVGHEQLELDRHPDTGAAVKGFLIPHWQRVRELCLAAAVTMPGIRIQGWDVAVCQDGPVLVEVNVGGDFNLPQIATGSGLLDERFRRFLADSNYDAGRKP